MILRSNNFIIRIAFIIAISSLSLAQTVSFTPAGQGADYMRYNVATSSGNNSGGLTGGFTVSGTGFDDGNMYIIQVSFDGTTWNTDFSSMVASAGFLVGGGSGGRFTSDGGSAQISVSHEVFTALSTWPGNDGSITLRIFESGSSPALYFPTSAGITWTLDLTRPNISTASISSNNGTNTGYATTDDVITLSITASENLMNSDDYVFTGNISGLNFITQTGSDDANWSFASTVTTHAEQVVTFSISYFDANYNPGSSVLVATTDGSTVIVDRTAPTLDINISSNNSVNTLAKQGDVVTLTISADETLNGPPSIVISAEPDPTISPQAQSSDYTATYSPTTAAGDPEQVMSFQISNVKDRAGNALGTISETTDASSVTFDNTAPIVQTITSYSNNSINTSRAKAGDRVTISFSSNEEIQTPTVLISGSASAEENSNGDKVTWIASRLMDAGDDDDDEITFTINYTDLAGNTGSQKTNANLEANAGVVFDNTEPNEPTVVVASSNSTNANYAVGGNIVSLTITSNENLLDDIDSDDIPDGIYDVTIAGRPVNGVGVENITRISGTEFTAQVQLTGSEPSNPVTYSFSMMDLTGNTRDVIANTSSILIDNAPPSITPVTIVSNGINPLYAKVGDVVTLSFNSDENLSGVVDHTPEATIAANPATPILTTGDVTDRTAFQSTLEMTSAIEEDIIPFTIDVEDLAGNAVSINSSTDESTVTFDKTRPIANYVTMTSNNANPVYARPGDIITMSVQTDDILSADPTFTIFTKTIDEVTNPVVVEGSNVSRIWTAQYTLPAVTPTEFDDGSGAVEVPFTLSFTDKAGNAVLSTLTSLSNDGDGVVTFDEVIPTLTTVKIASNNDDPTIAKEGDVITLNITSSENIKRPTITIAQNAATLTDETNSDGRRTYTATYVMGANTEGVIPFTVDFEDLASNEGVAVSALLNDDDGAVTYDKTIPSLDNVSIASNNANNLTNIAILGDQVTLTIAASEPIKVGSDPVVTVNQNDALVTRVDDGTNQNFTATYSMTSGDGTEDIESIEFSISGFRDAAGNGGDAVTTTTDGSNVSYDPNPPILNNIVLASSGDNTAWAKQDDVISLTFNSNEALLTPTISLLGSVADVTITQPQANSWVAQKTVTGFHAETSVAFSIIYGDPAGNNAASAITSTTDGSAVTIDMTSPTLTKVNVYSNNQINPAFAIRDNTVSIEIEADEALKIPTVTQSHLAESAISNTDNGANLKWIATHTVTDSEDDQATDFPAMTFSVSISDLAGNGPITSTDVLNDDDGLGVTYDNSSPYIIPEETPLISFTSDNSVNSGYASAGDRLTLSFSSNERLDPNNVNVTIMGQAATTSGGDFAEGAEPWTASILIGPNETSDGFANPIPYSIFFNDIYTSPAVQTYTESVDRDNIIFDTEAPSIEIFTVASNSAGGLTNLATTNDVITIYVKGSEPLAITDGTDTNAPLVTIDGNQIALIQKVGVPSDLEWEFEYTVPSTLNEGVLPLILSYKDYANNSGELITTPTDGNFITFDKTPPILDSISISSNNSFTSGYAKSGDIISITFSSPDDLNDAPIVVVDNDTDNPATVASLNNSAKLWRATYAMTDDNSEGEVDFSIAYRDLAMNLGNAVTKDNVTDGTSIIFDKTPTDISNVTFILDPNSDSGQFNDDSYTNDTTPRFKFTGLIPNVASRVATGDSLILYSGEDATKSGFVIVSRDTASILCDALPSDPIAVNFSIRSRDLAGNLSDELTLANPVTIDTDAPQVAGALNLIRESDSGLLDSDNITNIIDPIFEVSGLTPGELFDLKLYYSPSQTSLIRTIRMSQEQTDSIALDTALLSLRLSDNDYQFWYTASDRAGNESVASPTLAVTIDVTAPLAPNAPDLLDDRASGNEPDGFNEYDTGTLNDDNVTNLDAFILRISGLSTGDNSIVIFNDELPGVILGEENIDTEIVDIFIQNAVTGNYSAKVTDVAGNSSGTSELLAITVDQESTEVNGFDNPEGRITGDYNEIAEFNEFAPVIIDLIGSSDTGLDSTDNITNSITPSFKVKNLTVSDSVFLYATVAGDQLNLVAKGIVDNTIEILTVDASNPLSQNAYELRLQTKDYAGNLSELTSLVLNNEDRYVDGVLTVTVDTTPFTITEDPDLIVEDDTGVSDSDNITNVRLPRFQFRALEEGAADSIALFVTRPSGLTSLARSGIKESVSVVDTLQVSSSLTSGDYVFKYKVIDIAGNESSFSNNISVTIDYTSPSDPLNLDLISPDDNGPLDDDNLTNAINMNLVSNGFVEGEYGYLYSYDGLGDPNPNNDVLVSFVQLNNNDLGVASFSVDNNVSGATNYYVVAQDVAGNISSLASVPTLTVNVDLDPPTVDHIVINLDPNSDTGILDDNAGFNSSPNFIVTDTLNGLTLTDSVILFYALKPNSQDPSAGLNGIPKRLAALPINDLFENLTSTGFDENGDGTIDDGSYSVTAKLRDYAGNLSSASGEIIYRLDTQAPVPPGDLDSLDMLPEHDLGFSNSDNYTSFTGPQFFVRDLEPFKRDSVKLYAQKGFTNFYVSGSVAGDDPPRVLLKTWEDIADENGFFNGVFDDGEGFELTEGTWDLTYTIKDSAGNITSIRDTLNVVIDLTPPTAPTLSDLPSAYDTGVLPNDNLTNLSDLRITLKGLVPLDIGELYLYDGVGDFDVTEDTRIDSALFSSDSLFFEPTGLVNGVNEFYAASIDRAGNQSALSPSLQVTVDLEPPLVDDITITLDSNSDTGILNDNAGFNTSPTFTIRDTSSGLTISDSLVLFYSLRPNSQDPVSGLNGVPKRYVSLVIDNAVSQSTNGIGFDENSDGNIDDGSYTISARIKDYAGNFSSPAEVLIYRLDTQAPIFWDEDLNQLDPNSSFLAPDLMTESDKGYNNIDDITNSQNPSFIINNMHPFLKDQVTLFARKGFTTTTVGSGFVSSLQTSDTLTVPWVDANGNDTPDDGEGFALDNGTWSITYTVTDSAGNIAPESPPLTVEVDAIAPPSLGLPDLLTEFDTGESSADNLTNLGIIRLGQTDTIPGFKWVLFSAIDDGDGIYDENLDLNIVPLDSNLFPGGQGDDGLDLNGDGAPDGARSISSDIQVDVDPVYHFFSVQEDIAGNRSANSEVLTVGVDFVAPTCAITYDDPDGDGQADNLVKSLDGTLKATFTFDKSIDDQDNPPTVIIDYPSNSFPSDTVQLTKQSLANDLIWEYSIPLNESGMDSLNGILDLLLTASDRYGNPVATISGNSDIRIDNLPAVFSNVIPGSNSFSNADSLVAFSWNLDEPNEGTSIVSATVTFNNINDNSNEVVNLAPSDLIEGDRNSGILPGWNNDPYTIPLSEGLYEVVFTSEDSAGNIGNDTFNNFVYDTTRPAASLSFSRLYAEDGDTVVITAIFSEDMLADTVEPYSLNPILEAELPPYAGQVLEDAKMTLVNPPELFLDVGIDGIENTLDQGEGDGLFTLVDYALGQHEPFDDKNGNGIWDEDSDLFTFQYIFVPNVGANSGRLRNISISNAKDLADNPLNPAIDLDINDDGIGDTLYIDNFDGTAAFSYQNITNPSLTNIGIAGDTIQVSVSTSESVKQSNPIPTIDLIYNIDNPGVGDTLLAISLSEPNIDSSTWIFDIVLADSIYNDGFVNFSFNGNDLAENPIATLENNQIFAVDNLPPTYYETGAVRIDGLNPVQGWITGNTTNILTTVYIEDQQTDSTIVNGLVEIQFYNQSRGQGWVSIGTNSPIEEFDDNYEFDRSIADLYSVMDTASTGVNGLQPGDLIEVRAKVFDKHANSTAFGTSPTILKYDPSGPVSGTIVSGVFGTTSDSSTYTILSSDQVDISWTPFLEVDPDESGMQQYAFSILKKDSTTTHPTGMDAFFDTVLTATIDPLQPDTFFSKELFLRHNTKYIAQIVGIDTAGNYSDTLKSDTLLRLNSAPIIGGIPGQFIEEDLSWNYSVQITDPDITVFQGDSHIYAIDSTSIDPAFTTIGTVRGGTYRDVYLDWDASRQDNYYAGCVIEIGTAEDIQVRTILAYDGATRTATVSDGTNDLSPTPTAGINYNIRFSVPAIDSLTGVMSWIPRQTNVGLVDIFVTVTDEYSLADTVNFQLDVRSVNDKPESILGDSLSVVEWEEDTTISITLSKYFFDVDNGIMEDNGFTWNVVILDTTELDEDFPLGTVIPGPGTSNELHAKIVREYIGFDPSMNFTSQNLTSQRIQQLNNVSRNPLLDVQISEVDINGDGIMDSTKALFISDSNYYGAGHSIIFIGTDYLDSQVRDTITAVITAKNDPPKLDSIPDQVMYENDSLWLKFGPFASDVDNETLTFTFSALTNDDKITIQPMGTNQENLVSSSVEDSVRFIPIPLWSNEAVIQVVVDDGNASDTSSFKLDIERVLRPHFSVTVTQNNAFNKYFQITVIDTVEKAIFVSLDVANSSRNLEEIADFTYIANVYMESSGNYPIDVSANATVGDTTIREYFSLAAGRAASRWSGQSFDGRFSVVGNPGAISFDQSLLIVDSTLFDRSFYDRASYVLGNEDFEFNQPIEVRMAHERDDVAIYRRKNGSIWEELPSINKDGEIFTLSEKAGYYKLGPKTIIVPEQTSIHQNYPNPFNPTTTIMYDIGLLDGLKQKVSLNVYNLLGQHITTLVENKDQIGQFKVQWNGTDKFGQQMSSGVYFIQLSTKAGIVRNKKMMLLK